MNRKDLYDLLISGFSTLIIKSSNPVKFICSAVDLISRIVNSPETEASNIPSVIDNDTKENTFIFGQTLYISPDFPTIVISCISKLDICGVISVIFAIINQFSLKY